MSNRFKASQRFLVRKGTPTMWFSHLCFTALCIAQTDSFTLENARTTYSVLGAVRTDEKILPGDQVVLSFDLVNPTIDSSRRVRYSIAMEVTDSRGTVLFKQAPRELEATMPPGSKSLPACAM